MSIQLGPLHIDHPFAMAPMAGATDSVFRRLMKRNGCALVVSELVSATGIQYAGQKSLDLLKFHEEERPVGLQIFGEDRDQMCKAAQLVESLGAEFVDINIGCPVPKVIKKGAGAALLKDPKALHQLLQATVRAVKIPLSIKIRTGWDSESRNAHEVVRAAADAGVAWVCLHGRTRAQQYTGLADWDFIGEVKAKSTIPIIGNGDITTPEGAVEKLRTYGVDAVMIGRGALKNPFIFGQAAALWRQGTYDKPSVDAFVAFVSEHIRLLRQEYDERVAAVTWRKFLAWYSAGLPGCHAFRQKVFGIGDLPLLMEEARLFFEKALPSLS
jgi:nifR3 family TIM-barrel protein